MFCFCPIRAARHGWATLTLSSETVLADQPLWYVLQTRPQAESYAYAFLTGSDRHRYGVPVTAYYPRVMSEVRHAGRVQRIPRPFLSRLLFVLVSSAPSVAFLRCAPGVSRLLPGTSNTDDPEPAVVRQGVIDAIRVRENPDGFIEVADPRRPLRYRPGQQLRLAAESGPFDVLFGHYRGEHRAVVFIGLLGRQVRAECPVATLVAA